MADFAQGFMWGFVSCFVLGIVMGRIRWLIKRVGAVKKPLSVTTSTGKTPWQVFWDSVRAFLWLLVLAASAVLIVYAVRGCG